MTSKNHTSITLPSVSATAKANLVNTPTRKPEQVLIDRCLFEVFSKISRMATSNPDGLLEELQSIYNDQTKKKLTDYISMWNNYILKEIK